MESVISQIIMTYLVVGATEETFKNTKQVHNASHFAASQIHTFMHSSITAHLQFLVFRNLAIL